MIEERDASLLVIAFLKEHLRMVHVAKEDLPHVIDMCEAMEEEIVKGNVQGSFIHALCTGKYEEAILRADPTNQKYLKLYVHFKQYLLDKDKI